MDIQYYRQQYCKVGAVCAIALALIAFGHFILVTPVYFHHNFWLTSSLAVWLVLLLLSLSMLMKFPTAGILASGLSVIAVLRISGLYDYYSLSIFATLILFVIFTLFLAYARDKMDKWLTAMTFIRMYIGFDFMAHATEKLFAGPGPYLGDVQAFIDLHAPMPHTFVMLAGLCEFGAAIAIGLGLFTRLGSICAAIYLLVATLMGGHFGLGFIWANAGGGWEYPALWMAFVLVFAVTGAGPFSMDYLLKKRLQPGGWFYKITGQHR